MSTALVIEILLGLLTGAIVYIGFISAQRAQQAQSRAAITAVDAGAYERAREIYESAIAQLRADVELLQGEVTALRRSNAELRESNDRLRDSNRILSIEITGLRHEMEQTRLSRSREKEQETEISELRRKGPPGPPGPAALP